MLIDTCSKVTITNSIGGTTVSPGRQGVKKKVFVFIFWCFFCSSFCFWFYFKSSFDPKLKTNLAQVPFVIIFSFNKFLLPALNTVYNKILVAAWHVGTDMVRWEAKKLMSTTADCTVFLNNLASVLCKAIL